MLPLCERDPGERRAVAAKTNWLNEASPAEKEEAAIAGALEEKTGDGFSEADRAKMAEGSV